MSRRAAHSSSAPPILWIVQGFRQLFRSHAAGQEITSHCPYRIRPKIKRIAVDHRVAWSLSLAIPPSARLGRRRCGSKHGNPMLFLDLVDAGIGDCRQLIHRIGGAGVLPEGALDRALYSPGSSTHINL